MPLYMTSRMRNTPHYPQSFWCLCAFVSIIIRLVHNLNIFMDCIITQRYQLDKSYESHEKKHLFIQICTIPLPSFVEIHSVVYM